MTKKDPTQDSPRFLDEKSIQHFEQMARTHGDDMAAYLREFHGQDLPELFIRLLKSYRRAARVANIAWSFKDSFEKEPNNVELHQAHIEDMASALTDYAPAYFKQPAMELVHIAEQFEQLYNELCAEDDQSGDKARQIAYVKALEASQKAEAAQQA